MGREDASRAGSQSNSAREAGLPENGPAGARQRQREQRWRLKPRESQVCVRDERTKINPERRDRDTRQETEPGGAARASAGTSEMAEDPRPGVGEGLIRPADQRMGVWEREGFREPQNLRNVRLCWCGLARATAAWMLQAWGSREHGTFSFLSIQEDCLGRRPQRGRVHGH